MSTAPAPAPVDPNKAIRIARFFSYPKQVLYLLASFIALISICHFISLGYYFLTRHRRRAVPNGPPDGQKIYWSRLPAAAIDTLRAISFRYTIPLGANYTFNFAELGLTVGYIGVLFTWTFVNTTNLQGMRVDPKYFANRAGTIAASQIPIMAALGMRNNLVSWLTGVSFDKLNYLHRLSARIICILGWIHGGGRVTVGLLTDETPNHAWVRCGALAVSTLTLLCIFTVRPVRARSYEVFLAVHLVGALIFMLGILFHLTGRTLTYYGAWPAFVVWGVDRGLRLIQLALYNPPSALFSAFSPRAAADSASTTNAEDNANATITRLSPHFLRIAVPRRRALHWSAGQSAFLSFPTLGGSPFASHPFTIATIDDDKSNIDTESLIFILRIRSGTTKRLAHFASTSGATLPVLLNGPTSAPPHLARADAAVLLAGGSGVAFTLPLLLDAISRATVGAPTCARILFVWAVRDLDHIQWIAPLLAPALARVPPTLALSLQFHITGDAADLTDDPADTPSGASELSLSDGDAEKALPTPTSGSDSGADPEKEPADSELEKGTARALLASPNVRVLRGRPDVARILGEALRADGTSHVSVNVCGTHALAESVRRALRTPRASAILHGAPTVALHVEAFGDAVSLLSIIRPLHFPSLCAGADFLVSHAQ
ncbi:hypothetical protein HYPSUDRAFT_67797 [Hypholoma sublateritium FD-334 SS-4]|uniref:FAD-binding FR-type domain-containing protein n=1 Tax=Hypholoma sublateritium (strain FD-334 SS-4) TaxID=945553 RepID=A0A0D2NRP7_HYPSF|nr:hypothetical protein HYPSUDRAFT_67797 [Hypholoma sublateritium FD-334 SS-4]